MQTASADTLVPGCPSTVYDAALALASRVWEVASGDIVAATEAELLVHRVRVDGDTSCWLTWTFEVAGGSLTRVHLSYSDATVDADDLDPELDAVLGMLLTAVMADQTREGTS